MIQVNTFRCGMVPFGTKFILFLPLILLIIEKLTFLRIFNFLVDVPYFVLHHYECYRLLFPQFVEGNLYNYFLCPVILYHFIAALEKKIGTAIFLIDFFLKGVFIQIIFILFCCLLKDTLRISCGLWNFAILYSTLRAFSDPNALLRLFDLPCIIIQAKFEPPIVIVIDILVNQCIRIDVFAAVLVAFIEGYFFDTMMFRPSQVLQIFMKEFVQTIENSFLFRSFKDRSDFVLSDFDFKNGVNHVWRGLRMVGENRQNQVELLVN